jgi:hypothetical protein
MAFRPPMLMPTAGFHAVAQAMRMAPVYERDYAGTVIAVDTNKRRLNVRDWTMRQKSFNLSDHCECRQLEQSHASVHDLRRGEIVTVRYIMVEGVRIAIRVEQQPVRLKGIILELDGESRALTLHLETFNRELRLAEDCGIILHDGQRGTLADLAVGNQVTVTYEAPDNVLTARRIEQTSLKFAAP